MVKEPSAKRSPAVLKAFNTVGESEPLKGNGGKGLNTFSGMD